MEYGDSSLKRQRVEKSFLNIPANKLSLGLRTERGTRYGFREIHLENNYVTFQCNDICKCKFAFNESIAKPIKIGDVIVKDFICLEIPLSLSVYIQSVEAHFRSSTPTLRTRVYEKDGNHSIIVATVPRTSWIAKTQTTGEILRFRGLEMSKFKDVKLENAGLKFVLYFRGIWDNIEEQKAGIDLVLTEAAVIENHFQNSLSSIPLFETVFGEEDLTEPEPDPGCE